MRTGCDLYFTKLIIGSTDYPRIIKVDCLSELHVIQIQVKHPIIGCFREPDTKSFGGSRLESERHLQTLFPAHPDELRITAPVSTPLAHVLRPGTTLRCPNYFYRPTLFDFISAPDRAAGRLPGRRKEPVPAAALLWIQIGTLHDGLTELEKRLHQ